MDRSYAQGTGEPHRNFSESADQERNSTASYHPVNPAAPLLRQSSAARIVPKPLTRVDSRPHFSPVSETPPRQFEAQRTPDYYNPDTARYTNNKPPESIQRQPESIQRQPDSVQRPLKVVPDRTYDRPEQSPGYSYSQYTKSPTNNTYQSKPDLVTKPLENNVERPNAVQRPYQPADNRTEVPSRNVDLPSRNLDVPSRNLEVPPRNLDVPSRTLDVPTRNLEVPSRNLDVPVRTLEVPSRTLDVPSRNVTRLNSNNLESRPYENNKTTSENRPLNRELIENRPNHITENRQPFENHITSENRPIPRDLPENRLGNILENRPPILENRPPILENRIGAQEAILNRPTSDIQPRRIEVPGDRPRPEPPPILRQPSNPNLQPAPFRPQGGGVRLFRQFVNTQLIPARSPEFQRPLNPPISQDGMGLSASREEHNRLVKLARNEMESPRPESVTGDRPVRVEQPPPQRKPEPPFVEMQRPLTSTEQPDSLNSLKSNIMPSGKPVAKEMTITVSGKLPPQPQPSRPVKPENRPPIQVKKPFDEPLRMDSNLESQRPPFNESGNHFNDSSSSNITNYRRAEEYTENGRRNPEPGFYINDPAERFSKPYELLKRPERSMNFESNERNLASMAYTPPPENNGSQVTSRPGSGEHDNNSKQRPSDLNLSGMVSEKKGRVGWKGEEKKNNPGTPADSKGVSFVETPRKKISDGKSPAGTWCAQTGRFIPSPFERPKSPDPRPKTPTTPKKKRFLGTYCAKTGRYIPPEGSVTPRDDRKTPDLKLPGSGRSTPDVRVRSAAATPRDESPHVSFIEERCFTPRTPKKPLIAFGSVVPQEIVEKRRQKVRRTRSNDWVERRRYADGDHDSGVDESTQEHATSNGDVKGGGAQQRSRAAAASKIPGSKRASTPGSPASSPLKSPNKPQGPRSASLTPEPSAERKKLPMNKIQVGTAASPNLKTVRSKIGSLDNATHKPGGGQVRIESRKVDFSKAGSRIAAKNEQYQPGGGDKKIESKKLQWNAKSKIGSLENTTHKPGGGDKKIESQKLEFKDKAKSKVGSKDNIKHAPGGGNVKIEDRKLEFKVQSKVGSLANVTHKPGGGDVKIFDDKEYIRQMSGGTHTNSTGTHSKASSEGQPSGTQSPVPCSPGAAGMSQQAPLSPSRS